MPRRKKVEDEDIVLPIEEVVHVKAKVTPYVITSDQYDDLWEAFHSGYSADLDVDRKALMAALADYGYQPPDLVVEEEMEDRRSNSKYVLVRRPVLWLFLRNIREHYELWDRNLKAEING